jgi:ABC-type uncharacterized transport system permease subunit
METIQHHPNTILQGIIITLTGLLLCYFVGKRRFKRRGIGGLQYYSNYQSALITTLFEKGVKFIGIILLIIGLWLILNNLPNHGKATTSAGSAINHKINHIVNKK